MGFPAFLRLAPARSQGQFATPLIIATPPVEVYAALDELRLSELVASDLFG
jgi:hypothetical protein